MQRDGFLFDIEMQILLARINLALGDFVNAKNNIEIISQDELYKLTALDLGEQIYTKQPLYDSIVINLNEVKITLSIPATSEKILNLINILNSIPNDHGFILLYEENDRLLEAARRKLDKLREFDNLMAQACEATEREDYRSSLDYLDNAISINEADHNPVIELTNRIIIPYAEITLTKARKYANELDFISAEITLEMFLSSLKENIYKVVTLKLVEIRSFHDEVGILREAYKECLEVEASYNIEIVTSHIDDLLQKIIRIPYNDECTQKLKNKAKMLWAGPNQNENNYEAVVRKLNHLQVIYPMDDEIAGRYELAASKLEHQKSLEGQKSRKNVSILEARKEGKIWFWVSVITATLLLAVSVFLILKSFNPNLPITSLTSLLSLIPIIATKLIYDQAKSANTRADRLEEQLSLLEKDI